MRKLFRFPWRTPDDVARDVDDELAFHIDALTEDLIARGMAPDAAREEAGRRFGKVESTRRELQADDLEFLRRQGFRARLGGLQSDLRYGMRQLARNRGFTVVATLTLALGVGANTLAFSLLYGSLFRKPAFADPDRLAILLVERRAMDQSVDRFSWTYGQYRWLSEQSGPFASVASFSSNGVNLSGAGDAERVGIERVSASYFPTLGVAPLAGRTFSPEEDATPNAYPVTVMSYALWRRRYHEDPGVIGSAIRANGVPLTVIGIMPPGFAGISGNAELWITNMMAPSISFDRHLTSNDTFHRVVVRLAAPPASPARAAAAMRFDELGRQLLLAEPTAEDAEGAASLSIIARPLSEAGVDPARKRSVILLFGAAWLVLAVACVNLTGLELARARVRQRELAVRMALGAGRRRIVRQLVTEGALLAIIGCGVGVALAVPGAAFLRRIQPVRFPTWSNLYNAVSEFASVRLQAPVLLFAVAVAFATVILVSMLPAWRASRPAIIGDLRQGTPGDSGAGWTLKRPGMLGLLAVAEIALALMLAVGAGLLIKSFGRFQNRSFGFDPSDIVTFHISPADPSFSVVDAPTKVTPILERVRQISGVTSATVSMCTPLSSRCGRQPLYVMGQGSSGQSPIVGVHYVGSEHFRTLRVPLIRGRVFTPRDHQGTPRVAVINETAARRLFPGEEPLGRRIIVGGTGSIGGAGWEIIGVVGDVTYWPVEDPPGSDVYLPYLQFTYADTYVLARMAPQLAMTPRIALERQLRDAVRGVNPDVPLEDIQLMDERMSAALSGRRFVAYVLTMFAALAFGLAAVGVYGVASYSVSQRTREMGVRLALGAAPRDVFRLVVAQGVALGAVGLLAGLAGALAATRVLRAALYEVTSTDLTTFIVVTAIVGLAAVLATAVPARRATKIDPMNCLRTE